MTEQIERELVLPAPPEEVWEAIIAPGFLADEVSLELVPGGEASFGSGEGVKRGWVEEALAPDTEGSAARLVFWWSQDDAPATRVELTLEPGDELTTRLRVVECRPLELLDVAGIPLPGSGSTMRGPAMLAAV